MSLSLEETSVPESPAVPYRAMCPAAVASVVMGWVSIPVFFFWLDWTWAVLPLTGILLGWLAQSWIRRATNEWMGLRLAQLGMGLSAAVWVGGYIWLFYSGAGGVPYGYTRVTYEVLQPDPNAPAEPIPQTALDMQDKRVFIKGFMQPRRQQTGIKEFVLCPNNGTCPFCVPNPKRTEMIRVVFQGDLETTYTTHLIGVGGRFQVDPADPSGVPYTIEADCVR